MIQVSNKNPKEMTAQEIEAEIKELSDISGKILIENRDIFHTSINSYRFTEAKKSRGLHLSYYL